MVRLYWGPEDEGDALSDLDPPVVGHPYGGPPTLPLLPLTPQSIHISLHESSSRQSTFVSGLKRAGKVKKINIEFFDQVLGCRAVSGRTMRVFIDQNAIFAEKP